MNAIIGAFIGSLLGAVVGCFVFSCLIMAAVKGKDGSDGNV